MKAFVIAGEASGDRLGGALMAGLHQLRPGISFDGVGGPQMAAQGLTSLFSMQELSVMGIAEVLPKYRQLKRRIRETADAVIAAQPDVLITIDSPDFCLRVARLVKQVRDIKVVHYVAPSVWAWRPGRADKMAKVVDHVLALLPFEPPYMEAAGMTCDFVGHPVVSSPAADPTEMQALRDEVGDKILCVLPGSRRGEIMRMGPRFGQALAQLGWDDHAVMIPAASGMAGLVAEVVADWPVPAHVIPDSRGFRKSSLLGVADMALATSGTVSLELAFAQTPMVIAYDMAWLSRIIIQRMVKIDTGTLVNLVSDTRTVPEFIGARCTSDLIAQGLRDLRADPSGQYAAMEATMQSLGLGGEDPGLRAARSVLAALD